MIKCYNSGPMTCFSKKGDLKSRYDTADKAIRAARVVNITHPERPTKLVGYKCSHCGYYHLTSKPKRVRKYERQH